MTTSALLVTGASGQLGRQVLDDLLARKVQGPIIATTRNPEHLAAYAAKGIEVRQADFEGDPAALAKAFAGASRALLISTDALDKPGRRLAQHVAALKAFEAAGVQHVVYTSLTNPYVESPILLAPDHRQTEAALAASRLGFTVLRNNVYIDLLLGSLPRVLASGKLVDARGTGATGFVTRHDCALAASAALSAPFTGRRTLEITGPAAVTSAQVATWLGELSGKAVQHISVTTEALTAALVEHGLPAPLAAVIASFDVAIAKGDLAVVTSAVKELTGRDPQTVRDFLAAQKLAS
ncbi:NAD(P)H-binding protein [Pendulispora brunnea]|uniref:NAD(P)H-binding protein n=1 Tax=Pendulispora brunnea TaxID=2905690 RepID=A0ABZ2KU08_9BACT